ncbi:M48 family metalloprotease [Kitasatospora sp. NPDC048540]|uniref:M48 family metalloprotease n=1 Tax=unclassified Kitasatospora TaxID=2633591 RepID=UPI000A917ACD|nr:M48 family metalloprotease [Kitasatospora sp. MBT63]
MLLLLLPNFLGSLIVVSMLSLLLPQVFGYLAIGLWVASGVLAFHRPTERLMARHLFHLRLPIGAELARLEPVWREVTVRAGVDGRKYELWIEDSKDLNALAAAGHIVGVTRFSLERLPPAQLAAVLAHELGHHRSGHAWSSLLGLWYSLPGRLAWWAFRLASALLFQLAASLSALGAVAVALVFGAVAFTVVTTYPPLLLILVTPYLLAAVGRRAELRADLEAARLGFARPLLAVVHAFQASEEAAAQSQQRRTGRAPSRPGPAARLLASHPDNFTRIRHLENYLAANGCPGNAAGRPPRVG